MKGLEVFRGGKISWTAHQGGLALGQREKEENIILKRGDSHDKIFLINVPKHLIEYMISGVKDCDVL